MSPFWEPTGKAEGGQAKVRFLPARNTTLLKTETHMTEWAQVIDGMASIFWPLVILTLGIMYRRVILAALFRR